MKLFRNTATILSACAIFLCAAEIRSAGQASPPTPKKAEEQFKNIQTLKGIPADQLIPTMQFMAASLGVECEFCHVQNAFEKDDKKPKQAARKMIDMMSAINKDNFNGHREVTCYSCHRGNTDPVSIPAVMTDTSKEPSGGPRRAEDETKPYSGPPAQQLLDKFLRASGGAAAIDKVTSRVEKGSINFGGREFPIDVYSKDPDKRVSFMHMPEGDSITAFDGHEGWLGMPGRPLREMHGPDLDGAALDADLHLPVHLTQMFTELVVRGTQRVGDHDAYEVVGKREGKTPIHLYFDVQSGLLVRMVRYGDTALGLLPTQVDYADYRDAIAVKIPFRWTIARPSGVFVIQVNEARDNVPVDDAKFAKPAAEAPPH